MLDFIINPLAGGKNGKKIKRALPVIENKLKAVGADYAFHFTKRPRHAVELTDELIKNGATAIIVVGGDGTLHEVLNGFSDFDKVALGVVPCGTGNDFAAAIGVPEDVGSAMDIILKNEAKHTDFMQMPTVRGLNIIGMGLDVDVLTRYEKARRKTKLTYTLCLIKSLFKFKYSEFSVKTSDGRSESYRSVIVCVANGYRYGGGIAICPPARPDDRALDFVAIRELKGLKLVGAFLKLKKGKVLTLPQAVHFDMKDIEIFTEGHYTLQVDGQLYSDVPFKIEIVSDKLRVFR